MANNENQGKGKRILKGLGTTTVVLLGLVGFAFIEAIMTGADLGKPENLYFWLLMIGIDITMVVVLIKLISRI